MHRVALAFFAFLVLAMAPGISLAEILYRLPWREGLSFTISQAPGDVITTHIAAHNRHAIDISMPEGTSVIAARGGIVIETESRHGASPDEEPITHEGNFVRVRHEDGTIATYAHLMHRGVVVAPGSRVEMGALLGYSGASGEVQGAQLHFGVSRFEGEGDRDGDARYEVSIPVRFYVGSPPLVFAPRRSILATANYSGEAEMPRTASERRMVAWKRPELPPEEMPKVWGTLAAFAAALVGGMVWFWRFSRG